VAAQDPDEAVTWAFYAYENALVAVADKNKMSWKRTHLSKQDLAARLHRSKVLSTDVSDTLNGLNELRKDVAYGEVGQDLSTVDLRALEKEIAAFIDEAATLVERRRR
jgi:hypothetical protein